MGEQLAGKGGKAYPRVRIKAELARPGVAGVSRSQSREAVLDFEPEAIGGLMAALGWRGKAAAEAPAAWAAAALREALGAFVEQAANMCGYDARGFEERLEEAMERADPNWEPALMGERPWSPGALAGGVQLSAKLSLATGDIRGAKDAERAALLAERHESGSRAFVASMLDQFGRIGAPCSLGWSVGFPEGRMGPGPQAGESKIPKRWSWGAARGAGVCVDIEGGSAACAMLSPREMERLHSERAGQALSCWSRMRLLGIHPALMRLCGGEPMGRGYTASALGGEFGGFAIQTFSASHGWAGRPSPTMAEALAALRELGAGRWGLEASRADGAEAGGLRAPGIEAWLSAVRARMQSEEIRKAAEGAAAPGRALRI